MPHDSTALFPGGVMGRICKLAGLILVSIFLFAAITYYRYPGVIISLSNMYARWDAGLERKDVQAGEFRWVYLSGGTGETIVFLNGFGLGKDYWGELLKHYAGKYRIIAPDIPGFGESTRKKDACYDIPHQTARFRDFVNVIGLEKFHLVGVSMGGAIAAYFTAGNPGRVKSLLLMDAFGVRSPVPSRAQIRFLNKRENILSYRTPEEFDNVMKLIFLNPPEMPAHFKAYITEVGAGEYTLQNRIFEELLHGGADILEGSLRNIQAPTLVIWGAEDSLFHPSSADRFAGTVQKCRIFIVDKCGHLPHLEKPKEVIKRYDKFLAEL